MANGLINFHWFLVLFIASYFSLLCSASNKIRQGEILRDGDKIISPKGKFNLGFFSPKGSNQRYLGIWYADVPVISVVWVANRDSPVSDRNGVFTIEKNGNLVVKDGRGDLLWSTNVSVIETTNSTVSLLDTGNLVILNDNNKDLWQSFQHPTDTFLPEMRVYMDGVLRSWTSESDPSPGR